MRKAKQVQLHFRKVSSFLGVLLLSFLSNRAMAQNCPPVSGNFTINSAQPTAGNNFETFTEAIQSLGCGVNGAVVFDVAAGSGPYVEQLIIPNVKGASATNTITFNCNGVTLTFNSNNSLNRAGVKLDSTNYITFDRLVVKPQVVTGFDYGYGFHLLRNSDHNTIKNCTIDIPTTQPQPQNTAGIVINGSDELATDNAESRCDSNLLSHNTILNAYDGIMIWSFTGYENGYGDPAFFARYNQVIGNKITNSRETGIYVAGGLNTIIDSNDISGPNTLNYSINGINMTETNYRTIIRNNRIHDFNVTDPGFLMYFDGTTGINIAYSYAVSDNETILDNNLIYDFHTPGTQKGIVLSTATFVKIFHNTISMNDASYAGSSETRAYSLEGTPSNLTMQNNIANISRGGTGSKYTLYLEKIGTQVSVDRNNYFIKSTTGKPYIGNVNGVKYTTLPAMQTGAGIDLQSAAVDPAFTSEATGVLMPSNPAIDNMGLNVGVAKDITGAARDNDHPDVGAYEFLTPPCVTPVVSGNTSILPATTVCVNSPVVLNVNGNSAGTGQTYQWQTSTTSTGTFTNQGNVLAYPATQVNPTTTLYYRAQVTCNGVSAYSDPIQIIVNPALPQGVYTIDKTQPTANKNFASFNDAVLSMACGIAGPVEFDVKAGSGPYNEQVIIHAITGSSPTNTVTFKGNGETLSFLPTVSKERGIIKLDGADNIIFDSLKIVSLGTTTTNYGYGVHLLNDADNNVIRNCTINSAVNLSSSQYMGIIINSSATGTSASAASMCDNNIFDHNTITGGYYAICVTSSGSDAASMITGNVISNNTIKDYYSDGIYAYGVDGLVIDSNDISKPTANKVTNTYGIRMIGTSVNMQVTNNRIHNLFGGILTSTSTAYGIYFSGVGTTEAKPGMVSNNLIYDFLGSGPQYGLYNSSSDYISYYHNTISLDDSVRSVARATYGLYQTNDATGIKVKNNNFTIRRKTTTSSFGIVLGANTVFEADYNNYFIKAGGQINTGMINGSIYPLLTDWQTGSTQEAHSLAMDPVYEGPATGNLKPSSTSFNDKGTPVGVLYDIVGEERNTTKPDIGAYEFGCSSFPQVSFVNDSITVCTGSSITFDVKDPETNVSYKWYNAATEGTLVTTGISYKTENVTTPIAYFVEAITNKGCTDSSRTEVKGVAYDKLTSPVATVDTVGADFIRFKWTAVPGATGYLVSRDGVTFTTPSSGATGLTHLLTGLSPMDTAGIIVKAIGVTDCQAALSNWISGKTLGNSVFVPNTFTPNNDGKNDVFKVYGATIATVKILVFNQWGEKIFESNSKDKGWDGSYNGKQQPVGVYIYVVSLQLTDGTSTVKKGSLNLIR